MNTTVKEFIRHNTVPQTWLNWRHHTTDDATAISQPVTNWLVALVNQLIN